MIIGHTLERIFCDERTFQAKCPECCFINGVDNPHNIPLIIVSKYPNERSLNILWLEKIMEWVKVNVIFCFVYNNWEVDGWTIMPIFTYLSPSKNYFFFQNNKSMRYVMKFIISFIIIFNTHTCTDLLIIMVIVYSYSSLYTYHGQLGNEERKFPSKKKLKLKIFYKYNRIYFFPVHKKRLQKKKKFFLFCFNIKFHQHLVIILCLPYWW